MSMNDLNSEQLFFWKLVEKIGWVTKTVNYASVRENFIKNYSKLTLRIFCEQYKNYYDELINAIKDYNKNNNESVPYSGRDAHWDTLAHIVGLGYEEYMRNINNPKHVEERCDNSDYVENFSYCFRNGSILEEMTDDGKLGIFVKEEVGN